MFEIITVIIFIASLAGMAVLLLRKVPSLVLVEPSLCQKPSLKTRIKEKIKNNRVVAKISFEKILHKLLSRIRIWSLKIENKTSAWLRKLRERTLRKKNNTQDNYWQRLMKRK